MKNPKLFRIFVRIDIFIHACPPGKFESLSDLLSPELVQALFAETGSVSLRRRRMPMDEEVLWAIIGMSLFRHVPWPSWPTSSISHCYPATGRLTAPSSRRAKTG